MVFKKDIAFSLGVWVAGRGGGIEWKGLVFFGIMGVGVSGWG